MASYRREAGKKRVYGFVCLGALTCDIDVDRSLFALLLTVPAAVRASVLS